MIALGEIQTLTIIKKVDFGVYLASKEDAAQTESEQSQAVINVVINSDVYKM